MNNLISFVFSATIIGAFLLEIVNFVLICLCYNITKNPSLSDEWVNAVTTFELPMTIINAVPGSDIFLLIGGILGALGGIVFEMKK